MQFNFKKLVCLTFLLVLLICFSFYYFTLVQNGKSKLSLFMPNKGMNVVNKTIVGVDENIINKIEVHNSNNTDDLDNKIKLDDSSRNDNVYGKIKLDSSNNTDNEIKVDNTTNNNDDETEFDVANTNNDNNNVIRIPNANDDSNDNKEMPVDGINNTVNDRKVIKMHNTDSNNNEKTKTLDTDDEDTDKKEVAIDNNNNNDYVTKANYDYNNKVEVHNDSITNNNINNNIINPVIGYNLKLGNESEAMEYQNYASIAYCKLQQIEEWTCDSCNTNQPAKLISTHKSRRYGTFGMIHVTTNNKILLSFRGTDNLSNKLLDLNIRKRRMKVVDPNYNQDYLNNIKVHSGILSSTDSIIYDMIEQLRLRFNNELDQYTFVLIGHSLGGAMASLASIRLQNELKLSYNSIHLYSYGQPRVGNEEFVKYFNHLPLTAMRIVSQNDIVPHLPLNKMGYYHFNNEYFIHDKKAQFCLPPTNTPPYIIDGKQSYYFEHPECTKKFGYKFGFKWHKFYSEKSIICDGYYIKRRRKKWTKKFKSLQQ